MDTRLPLLTQQPNMGAILNDVQDYHQQQDAMANDGIRNSLEAHRIAQEQDQLGAMDQFRQASGANDPNAMDKLNAYPEQQAQIYQLLDGQGPAQRRESLRKMNLIAEAAQYVSSIPDDPKQGPQNQKRTAWNHKIMELQQQGALDDRQATALIASGPNDLVLNEAMTVGGWIRRYNPEPTKGYNPDLTNARIDEIHARTDAIRSGKGGGITRDRESRLAQDLTKQQAAIDKDLTDGTIATQEEADAKMEAFARKAYRYYGIPYPETQPAPGPGPAAGAQGGDGKSAETAAAVQTQQDLNGLPSGAFYIDPGDGQVYQKN